jgi:NADH-quinone oxidoreductase subunit N
MNAQLFIPELILLAGVLLAFCLTLFQVSPKTQRAAAVAAGVAFTAACCWALPLQGSLFFDAYRVDLFSQLVKCSMGLGFVLLLLFGADLKGITGNIRGEYYLFMLTSLLGLTLLVSSVELITLFISLELSSYSLYLLVPMRCSEHKQRMHVEASIKYLLFGFTCSGIMLFGISWIFGLTGTTYLTSILPAMRVVSGQPVAAIALLLMMSGFLFKLAVFPFHFWAPDVYEGAANETTAFISALPKVAAVAILARFSALATPEPGSLTLVIGIFSVTSMCYGNLVALVQTDVKRMLAYSGIAHAGYMLLGIITFESWGFATSLYYAIGYLFMMLGAFLVIYSISPEGGNVGIKDLNGLSRRSPFLALLVAVSMFGLAGIPPFVGFMGKFVLLTSAYRAGFVFLVIIAAVNTALGIYYYLQVVRAAYAESPEAAGPVRLSPGARIAGICLAALIIGLGLIPETIINMAFTALKAASAL